MAAVSEPVLLVYRALGLGDFLTGVPALRALARAFPDHRRVLAAPRAIAPLAALSGAVSEVADARPLAPPPPALHGADVAVNLHGRGPESHAVLRATGPRRLIAFAVTAAPDAAPGGAPAPDGPPAPGPAPGGAPALDVAAAWRPGEHEVARWCRMLAAHGIAADPRELDLPAPAGRVPALARGATVIHPGAASAARRWPAERWAAVARAERAAGRRVVVTGGAGERSLALGIATAAGLQEDAVLAGRTDLAGLAAVVAAAGRVACGDTGVAHLATAFGVPSVVLFGPTPPHEWGPPADRPRHRALWAGRRGDPHGRRPDPGLLELTPPMVSAALAGLAASRFTA